jgi:hypothetical protein
VANPVIVGIELAAPVAEYVALADQGLDKLHPLKLATSMAWSSKVPEYVALTEKLIGLAVLLIAYQTSRDWNEALNPAELLTIALLVHVSGGRLLILLIVLAGFSAPDIKTMTLPAAAVKEPRVQELLLEAIADADVRNTGGLAPPPPAITCWTSRAPRLTVNPGNILNPVLGYVGLEVGTANGSIID